MSKPIEAEERQQLATWLREVCLNPTQGLVLFGWMTRQALEEPDMSFWELAQQARAFHSH